MRNGVEVVGVLGVSGSPSCGVRHTLDLERALPIVAAFDLRSIDTRTFNEQAVDACTVDGEGRFTAALRQQFRRHDLGIAFLEHEPPVTAQAAALTSPRGSQPATTAPPHRPE